MENSRYLIFTSAGRSFSLPFEDIKIIIAAQTPTPVPDFPDYVPGTVVNEGEVVPVIDKLCKAPNVNEEACADFLKGEFLLEDKPCYVLDSEKVIKLSDREKVANTERKDK